MAAGWRVMGITFSWVVYGYMACVAGAFLLFLTNAPLWMPSLLPASITKAIGILRLRYPWAQAFVPGYIDRHRADEVPSYISAPTMDQWISPPILYGLRALLWDTLLVGVFAVHHSVFARARTKAFLKQWLHIGARLERSTFVLVASGLLHFLMCNWQPITVTPVYVFFTYDNSHLLVYVGVFIGYGLSVLSTFALNHFHLMGITQAIGHQAVASGGASGDQGPLTPQPQQEFQPNYLYRFVRHPMYTGSIIAYYCSLNMSWERLVFATLCYCYISVGSRLEEVDLVAKFPEYADYQREVSRFFPYKWIRNRVREWVSAYVGI